MAGKQQIRVWAGERKLLPSVNAPAHYRCTLGKGYLRIMSESHRRYVAQSDEFYLTPDDIATLTAEQNMLIESVD